MLATIRAYARYLDSSIKAARPLDARAGRSRARPSLRFRPLGARTRLASHLGLLGRRRIFGKQRAAQFLQHNAKDWIAHRLKPALGDGVLCGSLYLRTDLE